MPVCSFSNFDDFASISITPFPIPSISITSASIFSIAMASVSIFVISAASASIFLISLASVSSLFHFDCRVYYLSAYNVVLARGAGSAFYFFEAPQRICVIRVADSHPCGDKLIGSAGVGHTPGAHEVSNINWAATQASPGRPS